MKFTVYILESQRSGRYYIGQTNNLQRRLADHQRGKDRATRFDGPWKLVHGSDHGTRSEAIQLERYLKSLKKRSAIEKFIYSGVEQSGSSPGP